MSLMKWSPIKELEEMRRDMDRLFEEVFPPSQGRRHAWTRKPEAGAFVPAVEMFDRRNELVVRAELPGVEKGDIDLSITNDSLTFKGETKREEEVREADYYMVERNYGMFSRTVSLPVEVDSAKARASFKNGILEVVLPKKEEAKPKEIRIEVS